MNRVAWLVCCVALLAGGCAHKGPTKEERVAARIDYNSGVSYLREGDLQLALSSFRKTLQILPEDAMCLNGIGLVHLGLGDLEEAVRFFQQAIESDPKIPEIRNNLGSVLLALGRYEAAIAACQVALDDGLYTTPAAALFNIGRAYQGLGQPSKAEEHFFRAVKLDPSFDQPYFELARQRMLTGGYEEAEALLVKALQRNPGFLEAYYELAMTRYALSNLEGAERALRKLLELAPEGAPILEEALRFLETMLGEGS